MTAVALILGSWLLLVAALWGVRWLAEQFPIEAEVQRKLVHIALGAYCLSFPFLFDQAWQVAVLCGLAILTLLASRLVKDRRAGLAGALYQVQRTSFGEIFFAISIAVLFFLKGGDDLYYLLPVAILTLADAAAAVVGSHYGRRVFRIHDSKKSGEGVAAFFFVAWITSMALLLISSDVERERVIVLGFLIALLAATIEADSWWGLDNLLVPLGVYFILRSELWLTADEMLAGALALAALLAGVTLVSQRIGVAPHAARVAFLFLFATWVSAGTLNLISPVLAIAAFLFFLRRHPDSGATVLLVLLVIMITMGLAWLLAAEILDRDMTLAFHLSFGILAAALVGWAVPRRVVGVMLAVGAVGPLLAVQLCLERGTWPPGPSPILVALGLAAISSLIASASRAAPPQRSLCGFGLFGMACAVVFAPMVAQ